MAERLVLSACLLGRRCRYDGRSKPADPVQRIAAAWPGEVIAVCPEELGGLGTPRPGAELRGGDGAAALAGEARVIVDDPAHPDHGRDVTAAFLLGALRAAEIAGIAGDGAARTDGAGDPSGGSAGIEAILKARSPSCGCGQTSIDGAFRAGDGVFAALLRARGVRVRTDEEV